MAYIRAQQHSTLFSIVSVARLILSLGLNLFFIIVLHMGIRGILLSSVITGGLAAATLTYYTLRRTGLAFSLPKLREIMHFGLPYVPAGLGLFVINFADRFFLKRFGTLDDVGVYSLGYKFGMILSPILIEPFLAIWRAKVFELEGKEHAAEFYSLMFTYFTLIAVFLSLGISVMIGDVLTLLSGPEFHDAYKVVPIILVSYVLSGWYSQLQVGILLRNRTHLLAGIVGASALANLALNWLLIPSFGLWGAAIATLGTFGLMSLLGFLRSHKLFPVDYEWSRILKLVATAALLYVLASFIHSESVVLSLVLRTLVALVFPLLLWVQGFYHPKELVRVWELVRQVLRRSP